MAYNYGHNNDEELSEAALSFGTAGITYSPNQGEIADISKQMLNDMVFGEGNPSYANPGQYISDEQLKREEETRGRKR